MNFVVFDNSFSKYTECFEQVDCFPCYVSTNLFPDKTSKIHCFKHEGLKETKAIGFSKPHKNVVRKKD